MNQFLLFWLVLTFTAFTDNDVSDQSGLSICFFELDNKTTSINFKNKGSGVKTYQFSPVGDETALSAFERMIDGMTESKKQCDSLVVSGHHTGSWHGDGKELKLKDLEALSCNPKYKSWFEKIKALWLDGCNTVTDNAIQFPKPGEVPPTADSESVRVIGKESANEEGLVLGRAFISGSQSYAGSLDKNTSLSSRYLRMFPQTQIYGWNRAAPSGNQKRGTGASYIFEHLSKLGQALNAEEATRVGSDELENFKRGFNAIFSDDLCDLKKIEAWEKASGGVGVTEAIENQDYRDVYKLGCNLILAKQLLDNPSSKPAQEALANKFCPELKEDAQCTAERLNLANRILAGDTLTSEEQEKLEKLAKEVIEETLDEIIKEDKNISNEQSKYRSFLNDPSSKPAQEALAKKILEDPRYNDHEDLANRILKGNTLTPQERRKLKELANRIINDSEKLKYSHLLFNNIYDTWNVAKNYSEKDEGFFNSVREKLSSGSLKESLKNRITSSDSSSLKKADYIKFYSEVHERQPPFKGEEAVIQDEIDLLVLKASCFFTNSKSDTCSGIKTLKSPSQTELNSKTKKALSITMIDQLLQYDFLSQEQIKGFLGNEDLFPDDLKDPFTLSVQMRLELSNQTTGEEQLLDYIRDKTNKTRGQAALFTLSRHHFQTEDYSKLNSIYKDMVVSKEGGCPKDSKQTNPKTEGCQNRSVIWDAMGYDLIKKPSKEKIDSISSAINHTEVSNETRGLFCDLAFYFSDGEKRELCKKIHTKIQTENRIMIDTTKCKNIIKCP